MSICGRCEYSSAQNINVNVLFGRTPKKGSVVCEEAEWDGRKDPLFTSALDVIRETLDANSDFDWDLKPLFRLQMAYLLLWSSIERYVSLRYHLGDKVMEKIYHLANEKAFAEELLRTVPTTRELYRADRPDTKVTLEPNNPKKSIDYYYQIRSNITHRGKAVVHDHDRLRNSLSELLQIFRHVLERAFAESRLPK